MTQPPPSSAFTQDTENVAAAVRNQREWQPDTQLKRMDDVAHFNDWDQTQVDYQNPDKAEPWDGGEILGDHDDPRDPEALGAAFAGILVLGIAGFGLWMLLRR